MAENTRISWATHSFNPVVGCTKISAACDHCYAESWAKRSGSPELWNGARRRTSALNWRKPIKWNAAAKRAGERHRVFCASLADVFDNQWEPQWRVDLFNLIFWTPHLDWLLLTKRPQNIAKMIERAIEPAGRAWPWLNVWLGATVESPDEYRRIRFLRSVPAAMRFLSMEPLLARCDDVPLDGIGWLIVGGESGPHARPMNMDWVRSIRDQCAAAGVAFHFKQVGGRTPNAGGCELDGREHKEFPRMAA